LAVTNPYDFDFAVAGGGPAGAATAIALAQRGHRVVLFERDRFPRFHIGESLIATANEAFAELGLTERMRAAGFPEKWGAQLASHDGRAGRPVDFSTSREISRPQTYQVCREKFDQMLLERALEAGVEVRQGYRVAGVDFDVDGVRVRYLDERGAAGSERARAVVDSTGRAGLLARQLSLREDEPRLANVALYGHYSGVPLPAGRAAGDIRIVARRDAGWFWLIPIDAELVSVGVVVPRALYARLEKGDPERMLGAAIAETPAVAALMAGARLEWPVRVEKDFSYRASRYAGARWLLAGDAGSFLDPVFSTGVSIAMESGIEAARALDRAAREGDFSARALAGFDRRQRRRFEVYRRFVLAFYRPEFRDLFFQPGPPHALFRALVTVLAGNWRPRLRTRLLIEIFFLFVRLQRHFRLVERIARRDPAAGFPTEDAA
jgi:flavin-dependent dehydrogenase